MTAFADKVRDKTFIGFMNTRCRTCMVPKKNSSVSYGPKGKRQKMKIVVCPSCGLMSEFARYYPK